MNPAESPWPQYPENPPAAPAQAAPIPEASRQPFERKRPLLAGLLSGFPGMGNVYNGLYLRGLIQFLIVAGLMGLVDHSENTFFVMTLIFFWAFSVLDSYRQAMLINYGYAQDLGLLDQPQRPRAGQGGLIAGIVLTLLGIVATLEQYVDIDLRWLYDLWPVLLIGVGLWLIVAAVRERNKAAGL
ncbi:MAG TPA: DUF5668 domain-containing protein [Thermoanaerobaculia bacterium]|jgi:hypothetical protein|nr:DUF5668 domain-containing protein [Thermoanaerobaculia bacterium]